MYKLINFIYDQADKVTDIWKNHPWVRIFFLFFPFILYIILVKLHLLDYYWITLISFFVSYLDITLNLIAFLLERIVKAISWLIINFSNLKSTASIMLTIFIAFLILVLLSFLVAFNLYYKFGLDNKINDLVFTGEAIPMFIIMLLTVIFMFLFSLIFHKFFMSINQNEWSKHFLDNLLQFLIAVIFVFILGLNSTINEYIELYCKTTMDMSNLTSLESEAMIFYVKAFYNMIFYGLIACVLSFQLAFKIVYSNKKVLHQSHDVN